MTINNSSSSATIIIRHQPNCADEHQSDSDHHRERTIVSVASLYVIHSSFPRATHTRWIDSIAAKARLFNWRPTWGMNVVYVHVWSNHSHIRRECECCGFAVISLRPARHQVESRCPPDKIFNLNSFSFFSWNSSFAIKLNSNLISAIPLDD